MPQEKPAQELFADLNKAFAEFKSANDDRIKQIETKGAADTLTLEKVDKINAEITKLSDQLKEVEKLAARPPAAEGDARPEAKEHKQLFGQMLRTPGKGENFRKADDLRALEKKALNTQSDPDGGYLVPEEVDRNINRIAQSVSVMRQVAQVVSIGSNNFKKFVTKSGASSGWLGEGGTVTETNTPTIAELTFVPGKMYAEPRSTEEMLADAGFDIESWLADEVGISFGETEGQAFFDGNGVGRPRGLTSYTNIADASWAWGKIGFIASGQAATMATEDPGDQFINVQDALKVKYQPNAQWMMSRPILSKVRQFKDDQDNYLWQPGLQLGAPSTLLGKPVVTDDFFTAAEAANAYVAAYGDFRQAYLIVDRAGISVLRDPYTTRGYVKFYTTKRVGGGIQNYEAVKLLKCAS